MKPTFPARLIVLCVAPALLACAPQTRVDLSYEPAAIEVPACDSSVALVAFTDTRTVTQIGENREGRPVYGQSAVSEWVSRALTEELRRAGCRVEYHDRAYDFDTDYQLTGEVVSLYVDQRSFTEYDAEMRLNVTLSTGGQEVFTKKFYSTLNRKTVPDSRVFSEVFTELLQGVMREVVPEVRNRMR
jgi:hypothetical protein